MQNYPNAELNIKQESISLVIPVYNSEKSLPILVEELEKELNIYNYEIIFVNDGSKDDSLSVLKGIVKSNPQITAINLAKNVGQHNAIMAGLRFAKGDIVVMMDDDLQHVPSEIHKLINKIKSDNLDVVYGNYINKKHNCIRNFFSKFNDLIATVMIQKPKNLYFCSFKAVRLFVVKEIIQYSGAYPYVDGLIFRVTNNIDSIPVEHRARPIGKSNYSFLKLLRLWFNMFTSFSILPLRVVALLGSFMALTAFIFAIYIFIERDSFTLIQQGWASIIITIMLFSGAQLASIGLLGEYLGRTYLTISQTPQYVVREIICSELTEN